MELDIQEGIEVMARTVTDNVLVGYHYRDDSDIRDDIRRSIGEHWVYEKLENQISAGNTRFRTGNRFYKNSLTVFRNKEVLLEPEDYKVITDNLIEITAVLSGGDKLRARYVPVD